MHFVCESNHTEVTKIECFFCLKQNKCLRATLDLGPYKHLDQIEPDWTEKSSYRDKIIKPGKTVTFK